MSNKFPTETITVRTYAELKEDVRKLAAGKYNAMLLLGNSGLGKTRIIEDALEDACAVTSGSPSPWGFYQWCHDNQDKTLVLDDVATSFYKKEATNSLLDFIRNKE